jgi:hypothetical protein
LQIRRCVHRSFINLGAAHGQSDPVCPRLEAQLVSLDRGNADPARVEQIRRTEDMVNRQYEVDRMVAQSRRIGCEPAFLDLQ